MRQEIWGEQNARFSAISEAGKISVRAATGPPIVTFDTLMGRLQRLKTLAETVDASEKTTVLETLMCELHECSGGAEVSDETLSDIRGRLLHDPG